jgi:signal peptidase I
MGRIPPGATSGRGAGRIPPDATTGRGIGRTPSDATNGRGMGRIPSDATNGRSMGRIPPDATNGRGMGRIPPDATNGRGIDRVGPDSTDGYGRARLPLPLDPAGKQDTYGRRRPMDQTDGRDSRALPGESTTGRYRSFSDPEDRDRPPANRGTRRPAAEEQSDDESPRFRRRGRRRKAMPLWQELPLLLVVAFCLAVLIRTFLLQAFFIPSSSMETTLLINDRVLVNKIVYDVRDPTRGEVVVFRGPDTWASEERAPQSDGFVARMSRTVGELIGFGQPGEKDFIKRVIGLPGDTVACCDIGGNVTVNSVPLDESAYLPDERNSPRDAPAVAGQCGSRTFAPVTVGPGEIFVMGDHRRVSQDSRCQGPVPIANVIGRAFVIVWPSARWDGLPVPDELAKQPKPTAIGDLTPMPANTYLPDTFALTGPFVASLHASARSRRRRSLRPRTLLE